MEGTTCRGGVLGTAAAVCNAQILNRFLLSFIVVVL